MGPAAQGVRMIWVSFLLVFTFFMILALVANIGMERVGEPAFSSYSTCQVAEREIYCSQYYKLLRLRTQSTQPGAGVAALF